jgi:probable F420-dependent oxidoreductase
MTGRRDGERRTADQEPRRFRFGVEMLDTFDGMTWVESARHIESLGYSTLFAGDHLDEGFGPIMSMATAALATTELVVSAAVLCTDFRNPAFLARELASIDLMSHGRLEIGLGAGYQINDYKGSGIPMDPPKVRVERLMEHVAVLRGLFGDEPFNFDGEHYRIENLNGTPKPFTPGGPPIMVAGGGPRMLRFAARHADIIGVNSMLAHSDQRPESNRDAAAENIDQKFAWIREAAGPRFDRLVFHGWLKAAAVTENASELAGEIGEARGIPAEEVLESPLFLIGSVDEIVEKLYQRRERWGYSYYTILQESADEFAPVLERLNIG